MPNIVGFAQIMTENIPEFEINPRPNFL